MAETTPSPNPPTPSAAPAEKPYDAAARCAEVEAFFSPFVGKVGYNPYFYLHSLPINFFDIFTKVKAKQALSKEEVDVLKSIVLSEANAKAPSNPVDLHRAIGAPVLLGNVQTGEKKL